MENILINLKSVRDLLANPENWIKGWFARNQAGEPVFWNDESATRWDLAGAIWKVEESESVREDMVDLLLNKQDDRFRLNSLSILNDKFNHEQMLAFVDSVIVDLEEELNPKPKEPEADATVTVETVKKKRGRPRKNQI